ncbi:MAG: sodium-dependent transporter [Pseudomonadota bacterium]
MAGQINDNAGENGGGDVWSSRAAFILAAIGSAVGLGNLWRFPYVAGENGGGAFVIFYLICVILIGLPVLAAELFIGRRGGRSAVGSVVKLANAEGRSSLWSLQSWIGMFGSFVILTFYSVIAGWVLAFSLEIGGNLISAVASNGLGALAGGAFAGETPDEVSARFVALLRDPNRMILFHGIFIIITVLIVAAGKSGIEKTVTILMPAFFIMLVILMGFAMVQGDAGAGINFLLGIRLGDLGAGLSDGSVISAALGQAFFSIGLGSALMATYGAYMNKSTDIPDSTRVIGLADTAVGVLAGLALFPIVFSAGLAPGSGPTLMFQTLPLAFQGMPFGALFGLIFFVLGFFAAITSSIALLESSTKWVDEQSTGNHRLGSAIAIGIVIFIIGVANALSQVPTTAADGSAVDNGFNTFYPGGNFPLFLNGDGTPMNLLDFLSKTTDIILPIAGLITAIFAGWVVSSAASREELGFKTEAWYQRWRFLIRWVCPVGIGAVVFYSTIFAPFILPKLGG